MPFDFEVPATIELTPMQIADMVSYAIEKKFGMKIEPNRWMVQYTGNYDTQEFSGYKIKLTLNEVKELNL
jgi:CYTH domain-containing protein